MKRIKKNRLQCRNLFCRERGIRTPGTRRHNGFQDRRFQPLSHLSVVNICKNFLTSINLIKLEFNFNSLKRNFMLRFQEPGSS